MKVVWTPEAAGDLEDVLSYIATQNPLAAGVFATRIDRTVSFIAQFPGGGRLDPETGCREWVVRGLPLLIVYHVTAELVEIIALFHTSRDPASKRRP